MEAAALAVPVFSSGLIPVLLSFIVFEMLGSVPPFSSGMLLFTTWASNPSAECVVSIENYGSMGNQINSWIHSAGFNLKKQGT